MCVHLFLFQSKYCNTCLQHHSVNSTLGVSLVHHQSDGVFTYLDDNVL